MEATLETPGSRLRFARKKVGISATELAKRIGRATSSVTNHENGINGIPAHAAALYAETLGVTPQWLLYGDGSADSSAPRLRQAPVSMVTLPGGKARLDLSVTLPFSAALQILAIIDEAQK